MTSIIAKFFTQRILGETLSNKFGTEDPYFEQVPATRLDGTPSGKLKKRKKALPPGISDHDAKVLTKVKRRAYRLDLSLFNFCGIRFGWGSVIGLVPAIGDVLDTLMALVVLRTCAQIEGGLPTSLKFKMLVNIAFDFVIGLVPLAGDLADALFRANTRNAALLEAYLREQGKKNLRKSGQPLPPIDPSDPDEFDRMQAETPPEYTSQPARYESMTDQPHRSHNYDDRVPNEPVPAQVRADRRWFSFGKSRAHDEEIGETRRDPRPHHQSSPRRERR